MINTINNSLSNDQESVSEAPNRAETIPDVTRSFREWAPFMALVLITLAASAYLLIASPYPVIDEGGYINMLNNFFQTGKMDLMQWSQPSFLGVVPFALPLGLLKGSQFYSWCGIVASFLTMAGLFKLLSRYTSAKVAVLLSLGPLCQIDFVSTIPTIMSDQFFLSYFVWTFVWLDEYYERRNQTSLLGSAAAFALSVATRANGLLLLLGALVLNLPYKNRQSKIITVALAFAAALALAATAVLTTNRISLVKTTALPDILLRHDLALFDLRAALKASIDTLFTLTPALILAANPKRLTRIDFGAGGLAFLICLNFCIKQLHSAPMEQAPVWLALLWIPPMAAVLSNVLRLTESKTYLFSLSCLVALGSLMIMPIMPHPLTRHALPALIGLLIALGTSGQLKANNQRFMCAAVIAVILIASNYATTFGERLKNRGQWIAGEAALQQGIKNSEMFVDWGWFCAHDLVPGKIQNMDYRKVYETRESTYKYSILNGRLLEKNRLTVSE